MDWEEKYKKETGRDASYKQRDEWNANRTDTIYYGAYISWLEDKLELCPLQDAPDPYEIWAAAQLMPGEGIEDGVRRISEIIGAGEDE